MEYTFTATGIKRELVWIMNSYLFLFWHFPVHMVYYTNEMLIYYYFDSLPSKESLYQDDST
jgi:hypothetical protein